MCNLCAGVRLIPDRLQLLHPALVEQIKPAGIETAKVWEPDKGSDIENVPVPDTALPALDPSTSTYKIHSHPPHA